MKKIILLICIILLISPIIAQNLIPNGDFELGPDSTSAGWTNGVDITCIMIGTVLGPDFWSVVSGTPDRLVGNIVPCWDNHMASSGKAYIDFVNFDAGKTTLTSPLIKDSVYKLSYLYSLQTFRGNSNQPSRLCFKFSNVNDTLYSPLINDTIWRYADTIFIASNNSLEITIYNNKFGQSGANIDNIKLEKISWDGLNYFEFSKYINIYPNPAKDNITIRNINGENSYLQILNIFGKIVLEKHILSSDENIDISYLSSGIYLIIISKNKKTYKQKLFIIK